MKIEQQQVGTVDVLTPHGALVDQEGEKFCKALLERTEHVNPRIVVDMQAVAYMDSAAVESLIEISETLADRASTLKLAHVQATCREIFELTGTSNYFSFFEDVQGAVRSFL